MTPDTAATNRSSALCVGVFVDESPETVAAIAREARLDVVQLHGSESPADYAPLRVWKAFRITAGSFPGQEDRNGAEAILLDGPLPGTGGAFDWSRARGLSGRIILAGGLGPDNVAEAIRIVQPWGVDACSRLETEPGRKDHRKMRLFVQAAQSIPS